MSKINRLARSTSDLHRIVSLLAEKGVSFKVIEDPSIDTSSRIGKLSWVFLALIAEFEMTFGESDRWTALPRHEIVA